MTTSVSLVSVQGRGGEIHTQVPVPGLGVFLRDSSYGIWDYLKKLCFWELETKNRVTSLFEAYLKVPQIPRDYMCYMCTS